MNELKILVVDDEARMRKLVKDFLTARQYIVMEASNGEEALDLVYRNKNIDLVILDVMMPKMDGFEVARSIRMYNEEIPILMVTARETQSDKHTGFYSGADDYMIKPVEEEEMLLRIRALLRRSRKSVDHLLKIGDVTLNYDALSVKRRDEEITLPQKEFYLLYKLLSNPDKIFTRIQLMDEIWGVNTDSLDNTVNVHINRLRNRFEDFDEFEIVTVRGLGYKGVRKVEK